MLDLETMGTKPYSAIVAIGAVVFNVDKYVIEKEFYAAISLQSALSIGLTVDPGTVVWWLKQKDEARMQIAEAAVHINHALMEFATLPGIDSLDIWGNGSDFDNVLLSCAYERAQIKQPWSPFSNRCYRTIKNRAPLQKIARVGTHHNALDDAKSQAFHLMKILRGMTVGWAP